MGLEQEGQDDTEASESADLRSPTEALNPDKPSNYLSAMLTYIAQVGTHGWMISERIQPRLLLEYTCLCELYMLETMNK